MAGIVSVSRLELEGRRKKLRHKRQMKIIQTIWQTLAVSALAGGLLWIAIQPMWVLKTPEDMVISGNRLLSKEAIQSLLVVSYPQSVWRIEPHRLADALKREPTIAQVTVSRRLFPPGLIVQISERVPVAIAEYNITRTGPSTRPESGNRETRSKKASVGLIDAAGVWMPLDKDTFQNPNLQLPTLKVIGSPEQYLSLWPQLYQAISQGSVKVMEIDFHDPTNLVLKTELGVVYLGALSSQLPEQLKVLAKLRYLPEKLNPSQIEYIDLKNPDAPLVQMNQKKSSPTPADPKKI